ncbi:MAG: hypothetical protein ACOX79_05485 [Methanosarcina sp.]|jgi:hypothetical protein
MENKNKIKGNKTLAVEKSTEAKKPSGSFKDIFTQLYQNPKS